MLPPFGFVIFAVYSDGSTSLRAWVDDKEEIGEALLAYQKRLDEMGDGALARIGPAEDYTLNFDGAGYHVRLKTEEAEAPVYRAQRRGLIGLLPREG